MKLLAVDVGTGTQDILLADTRLEIENGFKMVLPAATMIVHRRLELATRRGETVLLTGVTMGGGPSAWAAETHARAGLPIFATPAAARSFNDDLEAVQREGIRVISEDEAQRLPADTVRLELRDFDFNALRRAFAGFGVGLDDLDAIAVAVFDHGAAPPEVSDRAFRFDYLDDRIRAHNRLSAFAYPSDAIPPAMTRLQAVVDGAGVLPAPLVVMDTAPAAVLGATFDPHSAALSRQVIANVGNFHTLAFRLGPDGIQGVFEHHTGLLDQSKLEGYLRALATGSLSRSDVFDDMGHGALIYGNETFSLDEPGRLVVTGPRRSLLRGSALRPHFAVPFGDMMIAGCFGLLAAAADTLPDQSDEIWAALRSGGRQTPPWEID